MATIGQSNTTAYKTFKSRTELSTIANTGQVTVARAGYFGSIVTGLKVNFNAQTCELNLFFKGTSAVNLWGKLGLDITSGTDTVVTLPFSYLNDTVFGLMDFYLGTTSGKVKSISGKYSSIDTDLNIIINGTSYTPQIPLSKNTSSYPLVNDIIIINQKIYGGSRGFGFYEFIGLESIKSRLIANNQPIIHLENKGATIENAKLDIVSLPSAIFTGRTGLIPNASIVVFSNIEGGSGVIKPRRENYFKNLSSTTFSICTDLALTQEIQETVSITKANLQMYDPETLVIEKATGTITSVYTRVDMEDF